MAKKIMALAMAIALVVCFAVSASAEISVATTTQYVDSTDIKVNVTVTCTAGEIAVGDNVTYYAKNGATDVHIDQAVATSAGATFEFNTSASNLDSDVIVGYTDGTATNADITGYTVTYPTGSKVIPTEATTVTFPHSFDDNEVLDTVTVTSGSAGIANKEYANGNVTVTFDAALTGDVTLAVTGKVLKDAPTALAEVIDAAAIVSTGKVDGTVNGDDRNPDDSEDTIFAKAEKGDRKLTVIGKVTSARAYGIVVSETEISSGNVSATDFANMQSYAGATKNDATGVFAIQLIDTSDADSSDAFVKVNTNYYTAVYALDANGDYIITAHTTAVQATVVAN